MFATWRVANHSGAPLFSVSSAASSSACCSIASAIFSSKRVRSCGEMPLHVGASKARRAATTAASTSALSASATEASVCSVAGLNVSNVLPEIALTHCPPISMRLAAGACSHCSAARWPGLITGAETEEVAALDIIGILRWLIAFATGMSFELRRTTAERRSSRGRPRSSSSLHHEDVFLEFFADRRIRVGHDLHRVLILCEATGKWQGAAGAPRLDMDCPGLPPGQKN